MLNDKTILITGGTGSFGYKFTQKIFSQFSPKKIIIYSRDEYKQSIMAENFQSYADQMRFFIGDVRDLERLAMAFENVDIVLHAAALKKVNVMEYNPIEAVKTNIHGAENVINAALAKKVKRIIALSTDKSVYPVNLYGATKMVSDKLFVNANAYRGEKDVSFSVVRYGNVAGSRGSVIPFYRSLLAKGEQELPVTDARMTRFWISLEEGVDLVFKSVQIAKGGEVFVSKSPSFRIVDLARVMSPTTKPAEVGIREGEKIHECMITREDMRNTYDFGNYYVIYPDVSWWNQERHFTPGGTKIEEPFEYSSNNTSCLLSLEGIKDRLSRLDPDDGP